MTRLEQALLNMSPADRKKTVNAISDMMGANTKKTPKKTTKKATTKTKKK